jgi:hypothetical protein
MRTVAVIAKTVISFALTVQVRWWRGVITFPLEELEPEFYKGEDKVDKQSKLVWGKLESRQQDSSKPALFAVNVKQCKKNRIIWFRPMFFMYATEMTSNKRNTLFQGDKEEAWLISLSHNVEVSCLQTVYQPGTEHMGAGHAKPSAAYLGSSGAPQSSNLLAPPDTYENQNGEG